MTGVTTTTITVADVDASIARVIHHAESIWDEWAWQVENETWLIGNRWASWDEMRRAAYGNLNQITAPRAERPELVARFRNAGLTQRETADTLGIGERTVKRHDEPTYRPRDPKVPNGTFDADVVDAEVVDDEPIRVNRETGEILDAAPAAPRMPPRRALTDQFFDAAFDLVKAIERVHRLTEDDRWTQNAEKVAAKHRADLLRAIDLLQQVANRLA